MTNESQRYGVFLGLAELDPPNKTARQEPRPTDTLCLLRSLLFKFVFIRPSSVAVLRRVDVHSWFQSHGSRGTLALPLFAFRFSLSAFRFPLLPPSFSLTPGNSLIGFGAHF